METRARYVLIGSFVMAVIVAGFGFVLWMDRVGGLGQRAPYLALFQGSVSGLQVGAAVDFDGIRVGEVTDLKLDAKDPRQVLATLAVSTGTPVRADTKVGLDFSGLTGSASIALQGGSASSPEPPSAPSGMPLLVADPAAAQSLSQAARDALQHVDQVLVDDAGNLKTTMANLKTFSDALARNSSRVDAVMAGLEKMAGGGPAKIQPAVYDLATPEIAALPATQARPHLVIAEPTGAGYLQTQSLLARSPTGQISRLGEIQWADLLPKLVQGKLLQTFENAGVAATLADPLEHSTGDRQLLLDLRNFEISTSDPPVAEVAFSAKIVGADGQVIGARIFRASVPSASKDMPAAVAAIDAAFGRVASDLLAWTSGIV